MLDRGSIGQSDWSETLQSTCTQQEEEKFRSFDYINQSAWTDLIQSDVL